MSVDLRRLPIRQFAIYFANGVLANGIDIGGFYVLEQAGMWYVAATFLSGAAGFLTAFFLHKHFAFQKKEKTGSHFLKFCLLGIFNIIAVALVLTICVEWIGLPEIWGKIIANGSQVLWGFLLMKFVVYT